MGSCQPLRNREADVGIEQGSEKQRADTLVNGRVRLRGTSTVLHVVGSRESADGRVLLVGYPCREGANIYSDFDLVTVPVDEAEPVKLGWVPK